MGLLKRGSTRLVDTFTFASGARQTITIQVPARFIKRLWLWLRGTLTISGVTVPGTVHTDGPVNLIQTVELLVDGKTVKFDGGGAFHRIAQRYDQTIGVNDGLVSGGAGVYAFEALILFNFESQSAVSPVDTLLDGRFIKNLTLNITWGTTASLIVGNTSTLALSGTTLDVYVEDTEPFPTAAPFWTFREVETTFAGIVTSANTRLIIPFTPGAIMRALQLRAIDGSDLSDAVINTVNLRLNGEEVPLNSLEDDFVQARSRHEFGTDFTAEGYYHLELASARVIVCALWQSLQTGSSLSVLPSSAWWMLCWNCSWIPWWQRPQVCGTFVRWTLEAGSVRGRTLCAVWQPVQVAVTVRPLF